MRRRLLLLSWHRRHLLAAGRRWICPRRWSSWSTGIRLIAMSAGSRCGCCCCRCRSRTVMIATLAGIRRHRRRWSIALSWRSVGIGAGLRLVLGLRLRRIAGIVAMLLLLLLLVADAIGALRRRDTRSTGAGLGAALLLIGRLLGARLLLLLLGILRSRQRSIVGTLLIWM